MIKRKRTICGRYSFCDEFGNKECEVEIYDKDNYACSNVACSLNLYQFWWTGFNSPDLNLKQALENLYKKTLNAQALIKEVLLDLEKGEHFDGTKEFQERISSASQ